MKLNISHPEKQSLQVITNMIEGNEILYRSPHVGNLNNAELSLALGIGAMGGSMQLELVDTIRGNDKYAIPRVAIAGMNRVILARNRHAGRIVGSCIASPEGIKQLSELGAAVKSAEETSLKQLHLNSLRQILPDSVEAVPSTEYFSRIGAEAYEMVLRESQKVVERPLRFVLPSGKIIEVQDESNMSNIYGLGDNRNEGLLPPLEAMMAIEIVQKALDNNGSDGTLTHIAGPDMIQYTKMEEVMQPAKVIADRVLSSLGMPSNISIDYIVPCMNKILNSSNFDPVITKDIQSQYDIILARESHGGM